MKNILNIKYEKFTLENGLEVVLYPDKTLPLTSVNIWYKVGSSYEKRGKTGFAHLFEHMMFSGSKNVPKEMHFKYIQEAGGTLNGSTTIDRTNYFETVPSNELELLLWLESDRMGCLLPALTEEKLQNQKEVVMNERLQRYDNQPYGRAWEILFSNLFPEDHPYNWPTIGWMEDIKNYQLQDVADFFKKFYAPNNASLVIGGDIDIDRTISLVKNYFGEFQRGSDIETPHVPEFELLNIKYVKERDEIQLPRIYLVWKSDKLFGKHDASLDMLADILSGSKNSRLYKSLVFKKQIAQDLSAFQYSGRLDGSFIIVSTARAGVNLNEIRSAIFSELQEISKNGVLEDELLRAKNSNKSAFIYSLQNLDSMIDQMNCYNCYLNEPNSFLFDRGRYEKVDSEAIQTAAQTFLSKPHIDLEFLPNKGNRK